MPNPKIAICAGEVSGDEHAAALLLSLKRLSPGIVARGMGGRFLRAAGLEIAVDSERSASVMGFQEILGSLGRILRAFADMKRLLSEWKPDVLVVVDYPDFNLRLAKAARALGIKVVYFITPKVWAWRSSRVRTIAGCVDRAVVIFPFEVPFFRERGFDQSVFLGHPFADRLAGRALTSQEREKLLRESGLDPGKPVVAIFPGSRRSEIQRHIVPMMQGFGLLAARHPGAQAAIAVAPSMDEQRIRSLMPAGIEARFFRGSSVDLLRVADAGLLKSGTSNLQAVFCGLPFAMFYIASPLSTLIVKKFVHIKEYSIVNILRPRTVKELILERSSPQAICEELEKLLFDKGRREAMRDGFEEVVKSLTYDGESSGEALHSTGSDRAAKLILDLAARAA